LSHPTHSRAACYASPTRCRPCAGVACFATAVSAAVGPITRRQFASYLIDARARRPCASGGRRARAAATQRQAFSRNHGAVPRGPGDRVRSVRRETEQAPSDVPLVAEASVLRARADGASPPPRRGHRGLGAALLPRASRADRRWGAGCAGPPGCNQGPAASTPAPQARERAARHAQRGQQRVAEAGA